VKHLFYMHEGNFLQIFRLGGKSTSSCSSMMSFENLSNKEQ